MMGFAHGMDSNISNQGSGLTYAFSSVAAQPNPVITPAPNISAPVTKNLGRDGTVSVQSGADIQNTQNQTAQAKTDIQNSRHILNEQMSAVKDVARNAIVDAAAEQGISPSEILEPFAKRCPEIAAAVDLGAPMAVQIAQTLLDVYRDRKSLSSTQVAKIANRAASMINEKSPQNKMTVQSSQPVTGQQVQDIMNETWRDGPDAKALDVAEADLDDVDVNLGMIGDGLDKGNFVDTDPDLAIERIHTMGENFDSIFGVKQSFSVDLDHNRKVTLASRDNQELELSETNPDLKNTFSMGA